MAIPKVASNFQNTLQDVADHDVQTLVKKDAEYGSSWKRRGGVGAFMMLARKWDRLETQVTAAGLDSKYDIFDAIEHPRENETESTLETIRDLRRYLLLVESEIELRRQVNRGGTVGTGYTVSDTQPIVDTEDRPPHKDHTLELKTVGGQTIKFSRLVTFRGKHTGNIGVEVKNYAYNISANNISAKQAADLKEWL